MLDGVRGLAILLVFLTHAFAGGLAGAPALGDRLAYHVFRFGWTGVDLFFVLSGYLITGILLDSKGQADWIRNFYVRRTLRIFPLYYLTLVLVFGVAPALFSWKDPQFQLLLHNQGWYWCYGVNILNAVTGGAGTPLKTSHFWSLCIEEQFYLVWPLAVWVLSRANLKRFMWMLVAGGFLFRLWVVASGRFPSPAAAYVLTPGRLDALMAGGALAILAREGGLMRFRSAFLPVALAGLLGAIALGVAGGEFSYRNLPMALASYPLIALCYGGLLGLAITGGIQGAIHRCFTNPVLLVSGRYAYGLYVVHYPILGLLELKMHPFLTPMGPLGLTRLPFVLLRGGLGIGLSYLAAWLLFHGFEKHFLGLKRYFA